MARQITYANDSSVSALDRLTGIDSVDRSTKNFTIEAIAQLFASTGLADVSKLAFFYDYNASTSASSQGQAYYSFIGNIQQPAFINEIVFNRYDSTGKDFEPLAGSIRGSHIKLTAVGNAADTNYGLYEVLTNPTISGSTITVSVRHLASSGTLPNDEISISVLSSTATGTGVSVTDGANPPVANATNHEGDLYIQIQEHETEVGQHQVNIWLYKNGVWVNEANLTGRQGEMGIQGFQGIGINTISGSTPVVGEEVTVTVTLNDPKGDPTTNQTFTVPAGAKGNPGDNIDPALLDFENDSSDVNQINVTYNSIPIGNFDVQEGIDGRSIVGIVRTTGDGSPGTTDTYTITYDKGTPLTQTFDVYNGNDGTNVTLATITNGVRVTGVDTDGAAINVDITDGIDGTDVTLLAITDGVRVTGVDTAGNPVSVDVIDGEDVTLSTITNGVRVTGVDTAGNPVNVDIENGDNVNVEALPNGVRIIGLTVGGLPIQTDLTNGTQGIQGSIIFRYYRGVPFADPDPDPITISVTAGGLINIIPDWDHDGVPATYDPSTENLWVAEYIWDPADEDETELLHPIKVTGPQGPGSGSSNVDGVVVNGTDLAVSESGTAVTAHVVPIAQGTTDNDTLVSKGYVDEHTGTTGNVKLTPGANQMITQASGTVLDIRGSFDLEDNAGGKSFDFSGTSGDIHIEDNGDIKLYFDKSSGKVFYDDANTGTLSTATVNELATQGDISSHGTSNVDDVVIDAGRIKIDEAGNPIGIGIELATGTADNDKIATQGYVDDNESGDVNRTPAELKVAYESNANTNAFTDNEQSKLAGIEDNATADQTDAEIKTAYENNANTNAFTDADETKLDGIQAGAQVNPTNVGAFTNDVGYIELDEVPVRTVMFARTATDDVQILSDGTLRIHLSTPSVSGFTYGFTPNQFINQVDGSITSPRTVALTGLDTNHTAVITSITPITGFDFVIAGDGQSFVMTIDDSVINAGFSQNILPTVTSTNIGTSATETHTTVSIPFSVVAPTAAPVQSNYFYYGTTNIDAVTGAAAETPPVSVDTFINNFTVLVDQISNSLDSDGNGEARTGAGADYTVVRDRTDQGDKDITFTGQNVGGTLIEFIAIPATITPSFIELVDGHQYPAPFPSERIQGSAMINSVTYNIYKGVNDQGAEYIITF